MNEQRQIESDCFPFEFLSLLAERASWRKEIHRPIYHVHKWWAKRLGSVFRGILLGCMLPRSSNLAAEFYRSHSFTGKTVFDPFMGSGTTVGEAHKLGCTALGRDINRVAVEAVATALGPLDRSLLLGAFDDLAETVGKKIRALYRSRDSCGAPCDVLYYFWVMQVECPECRRIVDLFPSYVFARNANPIRKPEVQVVCPGCGEVCQGHRASKQASCDRCSLVFDPTDGPAKGAYARCDGCLARFRIVDASSLGIGRPHFRMYAKLVLSSSGQKEYLPATEEDQSLYQTCKDDLERQVADGTARLPMLELASGHNTRQAMRYGYRAWRDFFNDRQLLSLTWLRLAIRDIAHEPTRKAMQTLFSGTLEFNNLFASYKGEGTGAVRHMFSHHILKPERTPIEANVWGTPKSSGSFSNLFRSRILRAVEYRQQPTEINGKSGAGRICSEPFSGHIENAWPVDGCFVPREIYLSCGDSGETGLPGQSVDLVVTDPPFFDNVHYSELADFFHAWQQLDGATQHDCSSTTRHPCEVQDVNAERFAMKLKSVFREMHRLLKDQGLLVFTYHHSRKEGWKSLAEAILGAGFIVANSHPVKSEMSVATPKTQAKDPIQLDIILVCRKVEHDRKAVPTLDAALASAKNKLARLLKSGFVLSRNDLRITLYGQLLTALRSHSELDSVVAQDRNGNCASAT